MADDPNRKTPRTFQCRDFLWESFEQMSGELDCSVDYLINEAMRHYLRAQGRTSAGRASATAEPRGTPTPAGPTGAMRAVPPVAPRQPNIPALPQRPPATVPPGPPTSAVATNPIGTARPAVPQMPPLPPVPSVGQGASNGPPPRPSGAIPALPQRPVPAVAVPRLGGAPPPLPGPPPPMPSAAPAPPPPMPPRAAAPAQRTLYAIYADQELPITKDEFIIGRGQKMSDLVIRDNNISRQHAKVVQHNGAFWIVDNQSTNGIEQNGQKIQQAKIEDGNIFTICGHAVRFEFR